MSEEHPGGPPAKDSDSEQRALEALLSVSSGQPRKKQGGCFGRGCLAGCSGVMLVILLGIGVLTSWIKGTHVPLPAAEGLIGPQTVGFFIVHVDDADPGVHDLLDKTVFKPDADKNSSGNEDTRMPWPLREALQSIARWNLHAALPIQVVITLDDLRSAAEIKSGTAAAYVPTFVISLSQRGGLVDFMFGGLVAGGKGHGAQTYHKHTILPLAPEDASRKKTTAPFGGETTWFAHVESSFMFSPRIEGVELAIDRVLAHNGVFQGRGSLANLYGALDLHQDAQGVVGNDQGQIRALLSQIEKSSSAGLSPQLIDEASRIDRIGWDVDVLSASEASVRFLVDCKNAEDADKVRDFLSHWLTAGKTANVTVIEAPKVVSIPQTAESGDRDWPFGAGTPDVRLETTWKVRDLMR